MLGSWLVVLGLVEPAPSWLAWDVPSTCPEAGYMESAVRERLGRAPSDDEVEVHVRVVDGGSAGLRLELTTQRVGTPVDARQFEAHDCRALVDAAALWVALSIDPVTVAANSPVVADPAPPDVVEPPPPVIDEPAPTIEDPPASDTSPTTPRPGPGADATAKKARAPDEVLLSAAGGPELGALPGLAGAAAVSVGVGWPRLRLELGATWIGVRTESTDVASVRVQIAAATLRTCGRLGRGRVEVPLCGGAELGAVRGAGRDGVGTRTAVGPWIAPIADAGVVGWVRPRLALIAGAQVAVPVLSMAFVARDPGPAVELYRTGPVSGRLWLGLETKFSIGRDGSG